MELLDKLNWRYATKAMNGQKIPQEKIDNIIEAVSLAPTSSGLQPFEVFEPEAVDEILDLREKGLRCCVMLPLGYRDADKDWLVNLKKVRKSKEDLVTVLD